jgi:hypothetical protein
MENSINALGREDYQLKSTDVLFYFFERDFSGRAMYDKGLMHKRYRFGYTYTPKVNYVEDLVRAEKIPNASLVDIKTHIQDQVLRIVDEELARYNRSIVVDNDDAFLRNMVPPHEYSAINRVLSADDVHIVFTPDMSPPPIRLLLPFVIGETERDLMQDLKEAFIQKVGLRLYAAEYEYGIAAKIIDNSIVKNSFAGAFIEQLD